MEKVKGVCRLSGLTIFNNKRARHMTLQESMNDIATLPFFHHQ